MKHWIVCGAAVLALAGAVGVSTAQDQTTGTSYPNMAVPDYKPVVLGTVVSTTSHTVTVHSNEAERMVFEVDSRTMMPRNLQTGTPVRVEFHLMPSGSHHAARITPLEAGSLLGTPEDAMPPASTTTGSNVNETRTWDGTNANADPNATTADQRRDDTMRNGAGASTTTADNRIVDENARDDAAMTADDDRLPQTASAQPWLLTLGLAACAGAIGLMVGRRQRVS
jgi:LPXTG-motif cell wall-anchored protein